MHLLIQSCQQWRLSSSADRTPFLRENELVIPLYCHEARWYNLWLITFSVSLTCNRVRSAHQSCAAEYLVFAAGCKRLVLLDAHDHNKANAGIFESVRNAAELCAAVCAGHDWLLVHDCLLLCSADAASRRHGKQDAGCIHDRHDLLACVRVLACMHRL